MPHAVAAEPGFVEQAHALGVVIIAALVEAVGEVGVALRHQPGAGQVFHRVFQVGLGVEQTPGTPE